MSIQPAVNTPDPVVAPRHCGRIGMGEPDPAGRLVPDTVTGTALHMTLHHLQEGERLVPPLDKHGEEVAMVLDGTFQVEAAGESYLLSRGEGIIIPRREARHWQCMSAGGQLYRVVNLASLADDDGAVDA